MIKGQDLKQVNIGQAVIGVDGPSSFPRPGLGTLGVIIAIEDTRWGVEALIEWQNGNKDATHSLKELGEKGIGVYLYPPKVD